MKKKFLKGKKRFKKKKKVKKRWHYYCELNKNLSQEQKLKLIYYVAHNK